MSVYRTIGPLVNYPIKCAAKTDLFCNQQILQLHKGDVIIGPLYDDCLL